ncbi:hypothetical protein BD560DRAFT_387010 [Blakeslea trispora]|nr:hypothetical protein BD560DRAFT_387010 [Blakeslea trispora]
MLKRNKFNLGNNPKSRRTVSLVSFECSTCMTSFQREKNYQKHVCKIRKKKPGPSGFNAPDMYDPDHYCRVCQRTYKSRCSYLCHLRLQHNCHLRPPRGSSQPSTSTVLSPQEVGFCNLCDRSWKRLGDYRNHMNRYHYSSDLDKTSVDLFSCLPDPDAAGFHCLACSNKAFVDQAALELHIEKYHLMKPYVVRTCIREGYWLKQDALNHYCRFCIKSHKTDAEHGMHLQYFHQIPIKKNQKDGNYSIPTKPVLNEPSHYCHVCDLLLRDKRDYWDHLNRAHYDLMVEEVNDVLENLPQNAIENLNTVRLQPASRPSEDNHHSCQENYQALADQLTRIESLIQSNGSVPAEPEISEDIFVRYSNSARTCWTCDRNYASKKALREHLRKKHGLSAAKIYNNPYVVIQESDLDNYHCVVCDTTAYSREDYIQHLTTVHPISADNVYSCRSCGLHFGLRSLLKQHQEEVHTVEPITTQDDEELSCDHCQLRFDVKRDLLTHFRTIHSLYIVDDCQKLPDLTTKGNYCNICDQDYASVKSFNTHLRRVHNVYLSFSNKLTQDDTASYFCSTCKSKFDAKKYITAKQNLPVIPNSKKRRNEQRREKRHQRRKEQLQRQQQQKQKIKEEVKEEEEVEKEKEEQKMIFSEDEEIDDTTLENYCQVCNMSYACVDGFKDHLLYKHGIDMAK